MPVLSAVIDFNGSFIGYDEKEGPLPVVKVKFVDDPDYGMQIEFNVSRDGYNYTMKHSDGLTTASDILVPLKVASLDDGGVLPDAI